MEGSKKEREYYLYNGLGTDILAEYQDETGSGFSRGRNPSQVREYYYGNGLLLAQKLYLLEGIGDPRHRLSWTNATLDLICYSQDALGLVTLITGQGGKVLGKYRYDAFGNAYNGRFEGCVFGEDEFDNFWDWDNDESVAAATSDGFTAQGWGWPGIGYGWGHYKHGRSWGILRQGNVYGFTGERCEPELGVYSFTFRDYNPRTMRWMTEDPVKDGVNWYQYCNGDPVNWVDPFGLDVNKGDAEDFWETRKDTWCYPLESEATQNPASSDNYFGDDREKGARAHAGADFHADPGTGVVSMTDGEVMKVSKNFYGGTDAVEIKNSDGTIARYTEIKVTVEKGDLVSKGQKIGEVIPNNDDGQSMLHLEVYMGTGSGPLTDKKNASNYDYVPSKNYKRRDDLIDPTGAKDLDIDPYEGKLPWIESAPHKNQLAPMKDK